MWVIVIGLLPLLTLRTNWYKFCENAQTERGLTPTAPLDCTDCRDNGPKQDMCPAGVVVLEHAEKAAPGLLGVCFKREGAEAAEDVTSRGRQACRN